MAVTQVATTPTGRIAWVWDPYPGSWHDTRAADISGLLDQVQPNHVLADKGYQGTGALTPIRKPAGHPPNEVARNCGRVHSANRDPVERAIAHLKNLHTLKTPYRRPYTPSSSP